jgi:DNA-binding response OmpR family regulator
MHQEYGHRKHQQPSWETLNQMKVFEPFRLDTVNHCLWRAETRMPLTPKAFDVLRYLAEHINRLVTQDEILEAL